MDSSAQTAHVAPDAYSVRIAFSFPATIDSISHAVERILEIAIENGCNAEAEMDLRLAAQEALANAVVHGCHCQSTEHVQCTVAADRKIGVQVCVHDQGTGFDENEIPSPVEGEGLLKPHGRGLLLLRALMDEVWFEDHGTQVCFRKSFDSPNGESRSTSARKE
jgi:serine/threonine-protein kinase RsbW